MKSPFLVFLLAGHLLAAEQTTEDCMAPDFKHEVILFQDDEETGSEYKLAIRHPGADKPLFSRQAGGYAQFNSATTPANFKCLWSPDASFIAIYERQGRYGGGTFLYSVTGERVRKIAYPDLTPLIKPHLTAEMHSSWIRPEVWLPDHQLILSVIVTQRDEERGGFRFILTLQLPRADTPSKTAKIVSFREDRSINATTK